MLNIITRYTLAMIAVVLLCAAGSALDGLHTQVLP